MPHELPELVGQTFHYGRGDLPVEKAVDVTDQCAKKPHNQVVLMFGFDDSHGLIVRLTKVVAIRAGVFYFGGSGTFAASLFEGSPGDKIDLAHFASIYLGKSTSDLADLVRQHQPKSRIFQEWQSQAYSVCYGIGEIDPMTPHSSGEIDTMLAALAWLSVVTGCPAQYKEQASKIVLDGKWGPVAQETHLLLARLSSNEGEQGILYTEARANYL